MALLTAIPKTTTPDERRVAVTPETVKKLATLGCAVRIERGAGEAAAYPDSEYATAGAFIAPDAAATLAGANVILCVQAPDMNELTAVPRGALLIGLLSPYKNTSLPGQLADAGIDALAMELVPRITRAQGMDVLSSQANLAGYKAVLDAAAHFARAFPMMMTAAGTIAPARVLVMGAGVAGLQAIATARRLGAIVSATDVRPAAKEQVASLGATFVAVEDDEFKQAETAGGYAKPMSAEYQAKQQALIETTIAKQDIVITTALIPGRPAPLLVTESMVRSMKSGSVIVDLAVESGGNCALSRPGEIAQAHGVTILGHHNMPSRLATDASALYARNLLSLLSLLIKNGALAIDWSDDIVKAITLTRAGQIVHPKFGSTPP